MLTETGRVVGIETDGIWVETIRRSTCGTCSAQKGCGHGLLNRISEGKRGYVRALPGDQSVEDYKVDDQVLISIPEEVILRGSFIAYILPILSMLAGAMAVSHFFAGQQDVLAVVGAAGGLALALHWFAGTAFIIGRTRSFSRFFCVSILPVVEAVTLL